MPSHVGTCCSVAIQPLLGVYRFYRLYFCGMSAISMRSTKTVIIAMCIYPDTIRSQLDTEVAGGISCPLEYRGSVHSGPYERAMAADPTSRVICTRPRAHALTSRKPAC